MANARKRKNGLCTGSIGVKYESEFWSRLCKSLFLIPVTLYTSFVEIINIYLLIKKPLILIYNFEHFPYIMIE
jgi:hypothetical protein